jgi:hypothetical protein
MRLKLCPKCNGEKLIVKRVKHINDCETITKLICKGCNGTGIKENASVSETANAVA